jgi:multidrug resistance efflux pump
MNPPDSFQSREGTYVTAGNQLMALVDTSSFCIAAYFKETQLPHIEFGQKANPTLMGYNNQPFEGVVRSVGWGVYVQDGSGNASTDLLPSISQSIDWVRLPQRFAVRIQVLGHPPVRLRIGQTCKGHLALFSGAIQEERTGPGEPSVKPQLR